MYSYYGVVFTRKELEMKWEEKVYPSIHRREFLKYCCTWGIGWYITADLSANLMLQNNWLEILHQHLYWNVKQPTLIVHLTDLHIDKFWTTIEIIKQRLFEINAYIQKIWYNESNTLVLCTWDLVNKKRFLYHESDPSYITQSIPFLKSITWKKHWVKGNHDHDRSQEQLLSNLMEEAWYQSLDGLQTYIDDLGVQCLGMPDFTSNQDWYDSSKILDRHSLLSMYSNKQTIVIAHNPASFSFLETQWLALHNALWLSWHTHGYSYNIKLSLASIMMRFFNYQALNSKNRWQKILNHHDKNFRTHKSNIFINSNGIWTQPELMRNKNESYQVSFIEIKPYQNDI